MSMYWLLIDLRQELVLVCCLTQWQLIQYSSMAHVKTWLFDLFIHLSLRYQLNHHTPMRCFCSLYFMQCNTMRNSMRFFVLNSRQCRETPK